MQSKIDIYAQTRARVDCGGKNLLASAKFLQRFFCPSEHDPEAPGGYAALPRIPGIEYHLVVLTRP